MLSMKKRRAASTKAHVDASLSRSRILSLLKQLDTLWPEEYAKYKTDYKTACIVDEYYRDGLPSADTPVKLLVVSESPCFTRSDLSRMSQNTSALEAAGIQGYDGPNNHVNLVHCLTYGESWALDDTTVHESTKDKMRQVSAGTPKFWRVLATLAGMADVQLDGTDPLDNMETAFTEVWGRKEEAQQRRLLVKHQILTALRKLGIALIDVSPHAIYMGSGTKICYNKVKGTPYTSPAHKLSGATYNAIIRAAFDTYSGPFIEDVKPEKVLFLGKSLQTALGKKRIEGVVDSFGGTLLETVIHPSAQALRKADNVALLKTLRGHSLEARKEGSVACEVTRLVARTREPSFEARTENSVARKGSRNGTRKKPSLGEARKKSSVPCKGTSKSSGNDTRKRKRATNDDSKNTQPLLRRSMRVRRAPSLFDA